MTRVEFNSLSPGDTIRHLYGSTSFIVTANYGGRVTAVATADATNPLEWVLVTKRTVIQEQKKDEQF